MTSADYAGRAEAANGEATAEPSKALQLATACLGGRKKWTGRVQGLFGLVRRSFTIESEGRVDDGALEFHEQLTFDDGVVEHRSWLIRESDRGLRIEANGVSEFSPSAAGGDELAFYYLISFGRVRFRYHDLFRLLQSGRVLNIGVAKILTVPVLRIWAEAESA